MPRGKVIEEKSERVTYPRYISNHPKGEDLFEGKSQERLATAIADHIKESDTSKSFALSRLIGVEGKWGSGKSNAIQILQGKLKPSYIFFTFDAWGNQEDLQRRSILELLTKDLLEKNKLNKKTTMKVMKPEGEGVVKEVECTWKQKLESLLSRKSYTRDITIPSFSNSTKWFILALLAMGLVIAYLAVDKTDTIWLNILIALSPLLLFALGMVCSGSSWPKMFAMYNTSGKSDTTSYVISEQEPSVREFKEWMNEISNGIPNGDKLVIVFDNMDRLPSEKVHQFWSLIQTFFAGKDYNNIWCIIPYDEEHLASAFSDSDGQDERHRLLRSFLDKTFSVFYRVPEPIVSDYKLLFAELLNQAYSNTIIDDEKELISRCYRHIHPVPNVREIISFINRTVTLKKQWKDAIHPISIAIFSLREYELFHNSNIGTIGKDDIKKLDSSTTEEYILSGGFYKDFQQLLFGDDNQKYLKNEISAIVYGVDPHNALQIVIRRYINNCLTGTIKNGDFNTYIENHQFVSMLDDEIHKMEINMYENAISLIETINENNLNDNNKKEMAKIWRFLGKQYTNIPNKITSFGKYESVVFSHLPNTLAQECSKTFCERVLKNNDVSGDNVFIQLEALFNSNFTASFEISKICPRVTLDATRYLDYVCAAGEQYKKYLLYTDSTELNKAVISNIGETFKYKEALILLKDDERYNLKEVAEYAVAELSKKKATAALANNLIFIQRMFYNKFQCKLDNNYIELLWQEVQSDTKSQAYEEVYALRASTNLEQLPDDERHINLLYEKSLFYTTTTKLLKEVIENANINCRKKLVIKMIKGCHHDDSPDYYEFIQHWERIRSILGVEYKEIVLFADSWGVKAIPETEISKSFFSLVPISWIDALVANEKPIAKCLIRKCVSELTTQNPDMFVQPGTQNHTENNWDIALKKLIDTPYITSSKLGSLNKLAENLLDFIARNGQISDNCWSSLLKKVDYKNISAFVVQLKNMILNQQSGYAMTPAKFIMLHHWLMLADIDSRRADAANTIIGKIVDDVECQTIILENKDYYAKMIAETGGFASELHSKLRKIIGDNVESEFAKYILGLVGIKEGEQV